MYRTVSYTHLDVYKRQPFTLAGNIMGRNEDMMWFEDGRGNRDFLHPQMCIRDRYNSDEYSYEVVSGLPGIRYPAAIIFNADEKPEFVIPAQKSTTHVFNGESVSYTHLHGKLKKPAIMR